MKILGKCTFLSVVTGSTKTYGQEKAQHVRKSTRNLVQSGTSSVRGDRLSSEDRLGPDHEKIFSKILRSFFFILKAVKVFRMF